MQSICPPASRLNVHSSIMRNNCKTVDRPIRLRLGSVQFEVIGISSFPDIIYTTLCKMQQIYLYTTLCKCNLYLIYTTLCSMQQIYHIHNVVQMQLISYIHNVGRWRHSMDQKCYLLLTNKTKVTLTIALTLTDTVTVIFLRAFCRHQ